MAFVRCPLSVVRSPDCSGWFALAFGHLFADLLAPLPRQCASFSLAAVDEHASGPGAGTEGEYHGVDDSVDFGIPARCTKSRPSAFEVYNASTCVCVCWGGFVACACDRVCVCVGPAIFICHKLRPAPAAAPTAAAAVPVFTFSFSFSFYCRWPLLLLTHFKLLLLPLTH